VGEKFKFSAGPTAWAALTRGVGEEFPGTWLIKTGSSSDCSATSEALRLEDLDEGREVRSGERWGDVRSCERWGRSGELNGELRSDERSV
jgi:hypothetical protein